MKTHTFRVRVSGLGLFDAALWTAPKPGPGHGQPEAKARRRKFSTRAADDVWTITVDPAALDLIADELELEFEDLANMFERYAEVGHRRKAVGIGGSTLGDIGEVLVWLVNRLANRELVRVVGYGAWTPGGKGSFPQPDFLVHDGGLRVLEVKSREAFDFRALLSAASPTTHAACDPLNDARRAALPQLGFDPKTHNPASIAHYLTANLGGVHKVVPFPCGGGVATAVLARDARVSQLESLHAAGTREFKAKTPCKGTCWACFSGPAGPVHAAVVEMPNSPGRLLLPSGGEAADEDRVWFDAYQRWATAVRASEPRAAGMAAARLRQASLSCFSELQDDAEILVPWLRYFWASYPIGVLFQKGLAEVPPQTEPPRPEWTLSGPSQEAPLVERVSAEEAGRRFAEAPGALRLSVAPRVESREGTVAIMRSDAGVRVELLSSRWWAGNTLDDESAHALAAEVWQLTSELTGLIPPLAGGLPVPSRVEVARHLPEEDRLHLGWVLQPERSVRWWRYRGWPYRGWLGGPWPWPLRLHITPDGRSILRLGYPEAS